MNTERLPNPVRFTYNPDGQLATVITPGNHTWTYGYDSAGRQTSATSPTGLVATDSYDSAGNLTSTMEPGLGTTRTTYSGSGQVTSQTDSLDADVLYSYDEAGRMSASTDAEGGETTYGYDNAGRLAARTDPRGGETKFAYDDGGLLTTETDPLNRTTSYGYDTRGNVVSKTDPDDNKTTYEYDQVGQVASRTDPSGATSTFNYNARGQRLTMADATGTTKYTYDAAGQLTKLDIANGSTYFFTYDGNGRSATITYPDGTVVSYGRDADGNLAAVSDNHGHSLSYSLDADGRVTREGSGAGMVRTFSYLAGQLRQYTEQMTTTSPTNSTEISRDAAGRVTSTLAAGATTGYSYDAAGQLTTVNAPGIDTDVAYTYDGAGNRATSTSGANDIDTYVYDVANQLTSITRNGATQATLGYDGSGRLTEKTLANGYSQAFEYDGTTAPTRIDTTNATGQSIAKLGRDGDGYPTTVTTTLGATGDSAAVTSEVALDWLTLEGLPQVASLTGDTVNGGAATNFSYGMGSTRLQMFSGTTGADISRDVYGSDMTTPDTAALVSAGLYDAFGATTSSADLAVGFGYRGQLTVAGVPLMDARAYDATTGRFTAPDPLAPVPGAAASTTAYPYVNNDPLNLIDPLGLRSVDDSAFSYNAGYTSVAPAAQPSHPINCATDMKVGMSNAPVAINSACGRAFTAEALKTAPQWQKDLYQVQLGINSFTDKVGPVIAIAIMAGGGSGSSSLVKTSRPLVKTATLDPALASGEGAATVKAATPPAGSTTAKAMAAGKPNLPSATTTILGPKGEAIPLPISGPGTLSNNGYGYNYAVPSGTPGLHKNVDLVRVTHSDPKAAFQYPNGYVVYYKGTQVVNPLTGQTIKSSDPYSHIPIP